MRRWQHEEPAAWVVDDFLMELPQRVAVTLEGRQVQVRCWRYDVTGASGFIVPVYFLDTDLPENTEWDRTLTDFLYGGDQHYRLCQEVILGIGGVRMLRALGHVRHGAVSSERRACQPAHRRTAGRGAEKRAAPRDH